jgi:GNAT superfamily N-acetyltransferase
MQEQLIIRPAREDDRAAVLDFTATVWDGHDYIGRVWDSWLDRPDGPLLAAELDGQTVGIAKLTDLSEGEGWIMGVRVAERVRGRGIARALLARCVELSRERGDRCLRFMTSAGTVPMQRAAATGFHLAVDGSWFHGPPVNSPSRALPVPPDRLPVLLDDLATSEVEPLYIYDWRCRTLSEGRLRDHLERGQALHLPGSRAWAVVIPRDNLWVGFGHGEEAALAELLRAIRADSAPARPGAARPCGDGKSAQPCAPRRRLRRRRPSRAVLRAALLEALSYETRTRLPHNTHGKRHRWSLVTSVEPTTGDAVL